MSTAGLVIIGNEVLSGKVEEENARFLIRELRSLGVSLERVVFIRDDIDTIARDVRQMADAYDHVITSGGVGSTHDDVTLQAIARAFDIPLAEDEALSALLKTHYGDRLSAPVLRMATIPQEARLIGIETARFPLVAVRNVFVFPGVPSFLRSKFDLIRDVLRTAPFFIAEVFLRVGEARIAEPLAQMDEAYVHVEFGSYPRFDDADHRVKVTMESRDCGEVCRAANAFVGALSPRDVVRVTLPELL